MNIKRYLRAAQALLLTLALVLGSVPGAAFAAGDDGLFYGKAEYYSKISKSYVTAGFYCSDDWFLGDPAARNDGLALVSAKLAASAGDADHGEAFLEALGFDNIASKRFASSENDCAYTVGTKTIDNGGKVVTLAAVVFQGDNYGDKGWQQNVTVNVDGVDTEDQASYEACAKAFLSDLEGMGLGEDTVFWLCGQSRGGAVANLAAAYMLDGDNGAKVFCRTFESPATTQSASAGSSLYACIHNYTADDDPVVMLPIWGMGRYGQDIIYNTASVDEVKGELEKLNPDAVRYAEEYDTSAFGGDVKGFLEGLMDKLGSVVKARPDYSKTIAEEIPGEGKIEYSWQGGLQALCHIIFGMDGEILSKFMSLLPYLDPLAYSAVEERYVLEHSPADSAELLADASLKRWDAAAALYDSLSESGGSPAEKADLYALLRLLIPLITNTDAVADEDFELPSEDSFYSGDYFSISMLTGASSLVFSHHPDVIIARLSLMAPAPEMEEIALEISTPAAGDEAGKAPSEAAESAEGLGYLWLERAEGSWLSEDSELKDGKKYHLQMVLEVTGRSVPESPAVLLNGSKPESLDISYEDGSAVITATWAFAVGEPSSVTVRFDSNGHGSTPEAFSVNEGTLFRFVDEPEDQGDVRDESGTWRFNGWTTGDGTPWAEAAADGDVTFYADWLRVIDEIIVSYEIPRVGDRGKALEKLSIPEDAPYKIVFEGVYDEDWYEVSRVKNTKPLMVSFTIYPKDGVILPYDQPEEWERLFPGTMLINGEDQGTVEVGTEYLDDDVEVLFVHYQYSFEPLPAEKSSDDDDDGSSGRSGSGSGGGSGSGSGSGQDTAAPVFIDVAKDAWYAEAVAWAAKKGVTDGTGNGLFSPDAPCTRAQMAAFIWKLHGSPAPTGEGSSAYEEVGYPPFSDVPADAWYADAVLWAFENGVVNGIGEGLFAPNKTLSRAECVTMLSRCANGKATDDYECPFTDVPTGAWYEEAVRWASQKGLVKGRSEGLFVPEDYCTRAEIVTMLYRLFGE
ncbi:MAG: S-layer homology domain-containing protein [Firmicutes bacterium]|nr:S-layer homology domain-containing protein [Bacillota bacterium]